MGLLALWQISAGLVWGATLSLSSGCHAGSGAQVLEMATKRRFEPVSPVQFTESKNV